MKKKIIINELFCIFTTLKKKLNINTGKKIKENYIQILTKKKKQK